MHFIATHDALLYQIAFHSLNQHSPQPSVVWEYQNVVWTYHNSSGDWAYRRLACNKRKIKRKKPQRSKSISIMGASSKGVNGIWNLCASFTPWCYMTVVEVTWQLLAHMVVMWEPLESVFLSAWWCKVWDTPNLSSGWWESNRRYWYRFSISRLPPFFRETTQSRNACLLFDMPSVVRLMLSFTELMCFVKATTLQVLFFPHMPSTYLNQWLKTPALYPY